MMGWQCPGCGRCFSPSMVMCSFCGPQTTVTLPGIVINPAPCVHEFDTESTVPRCKKCGQSMLQWPPDTTITWGSVSYQ